MKYWNTSTVRNPHHPTTPPRPPHPLPDPPPPTPYDIRYMMSSGSCLQLTAYVNQRSFGATLVPQANGNIEDCIEYCRNQGSSACAAIDWERKQRPFKGMYIYVNSARDISVLMWLSWALYCYCYAAIIGWNNYAGGQIAVVILGPSRPLLTSKWKVLS